MGLTLLEGGVYPFPFFCLLLVFDTLIRTTSLRRTWRLAKAAAVTVPMIAATSAFRLLPILDTMKRYPRPLTGEVCVPSSWIACLGSKFYPPDKLTLSEVADILTSREYVYSAPGHEYVWAEYGAFIGTAAVTVVLLGLVPTWRTRRSLILGAVLFGWLMMGTVTEWSPWPILHRLPVFDSLRVPSRFVVFFLFFAALIGANALSGLARLSRQRFVRTTLLVIPLCVTGEIFWGNSETIDRWRADPIPPLAAPGHHHLLPSSEYGRYAQFPALDVGNPSCYTGMAYEAARGLWTGPVPQARVERNAGEVLTSRRTSNTIAAKVSMTDSGRVVFNQTWAEGWRTSTGTLTKDELGRIAVDLPAMGERWVKLRYEPPQLYPALGLAGFGIGLPAMWWWWLPRRRRRLFRKQTTNT